MRRHTRLLLDLRLAIAIAHDGVRAGKLSRARLLLIVNARGLPNEHEREAIRAERANRPFPQAARDEPVS